MKVGVISLDRGRLRFGKRFRTFLVLKSKSSASKTATFQCLFLRER